MELKTYLCFYGISLAIAILYYYIVYKGYHKTKYDLSTPRSLREAYPVLF